MYAHPAHLTDGIIAAIAGSAHAVPYLDLPIQHISGRILAAMNRRIAPDDIRRRIRGLRAAVPGIAIRTTLITGLPGETEAEFGGLLRFVEEFEFERLGVFAYRPEPGTPAAVMPDQVPPGLAEERRAAIMETQAKISLIHNRALVGTVFDVIIDRVQGAAAIGRSKSDAPEIDNQVAVIGGRLKPGAVARATATAADAYSITMTAAGRDAAAASTEI
jgi:ribosomal protein S12 methylthiotransferase